MAFSTNNPYSVLQTLQEGDERTETKEERTLRFLQYQCSYRHCKYPLDTWGEIIIKDYPHFVELMCKHVPAESKTFEALCEKLGPLDLEKAKTTERVYTSESDSDRRDRYLDMTCSHNGRMKGKKWSEILNTDYGYFIWSVGNTMGRDTRTFNVFVECLTESDKRMVMCTPKGKVKVKSNGKYTKKP